MLFHNIRPNADQTQVPNLSVRSIGRMQGGIGGLVFSTYSAVRRQVNQYAEEEDRLSRVSPAAASDEHHMTSNGRRGARSLFG